MNPVHRFLYWNMNYHTEHHMFPLVPYHQLPRLHALVKDDCPAPYPSLHGRLPRDDPGDAAADARAGLVRPPHAAATARPVGTRPTAPAITTDGRPVVGRLDRRVRGRRARDRGRAPFRSRSPDLRDLPHRRRARVHATDGMCTHGNTHLADGMVSGTLVECSEAQRPLRRDQRRAAAPARLRGAANAPRARSGRAHPARRRSRAAGADTATQVYTLRVVSNRNVATFIKELVLAPLETTSIGIGTGYRVPGAGCRRPNAAGRR